MEHELKQGNESQPAATAAAEASSAGEPGEEMWTQAPFSVSNSLHIKMRDWDASLRCPICHEFFENPVSVMPCHHTFCSFCIRNCFKASLKGMKRTASCPVCRINVDTGGVDFKCLVSNRTVEDMVKKYKDLRGDLQKSLCELATGGSATVNAVADAGELSESVKKRKRSTHQPNYSEEEETLPDEKVIEIKELSVPRKKRSATHYSCLKKKHLIELCQADGLSTRGSEAELKARHEEFVTLFNAECDSFTPRPVSELVKEIARREHARREESMQARYNGSYAHSTHMERLKKSRKALGEAENGYASVSSGNAAFDAKLNSKFSAMIQQVRERMGKKKPPSNDASSDKEGMQHPPSNDVAKTNEVLQPTMVNGVTGNGAFAALDNPNEVKVPPLSKASTPNVAAGESSGQISANASPMPSLSPIQAQQAQTFPTVTHAPARASMPTPREKKMRSSSEKKNRPTRSWVCHMCTYVNKKHTWAGARCEMCMTERNNENKGSGDTVVLLEC